MSEIWASPTPPTPRRWRGWVGDPSSRRWFTILMALLGARSSGQQGYSTKKYQLTFAQFSRWLSDSLPTKCESTRRCFQPGTNRGLLRDCEKFAKGSFEALVSWLLPAPALAIMSNLPRLVRTLSWFPLNTRPACNLLCLHGSVGFVSPQS